MSWPKDPEKRALAVARHRAAQRLRWEDKENRAKAREAARQQFADPAAREKMSALKRALYKDKDRRDALIAQLRSVTVPGGKHRSSAIRAAWEKKRSLRRWREGVMRERAARMIGLAHGTTPSRAAAAPEPGPGSMARTGDPLSRRDSRQAGR